MSERILKALMQLFAIVAKVDGVTNNGREIVQSFLKQQLNQELVDEYLKLFDQFLDAHHNLSDSTKKRKRTSVNSVKVLLICTQINTELTQKQKVVVLIRLIEFIASSGEITEQELEFVQTVSQTFNIDDIEFQRCMEFINVKDQEAIVDSANLLVIDHNKEIKSGLTKTRHIQVDSLAGQLRILSIQSVGMYVLRYFGTHELYLNGQAINQDRAYILTQGSSIRSSKVNPIYYSDIISAFMSDKEQSRILFEARSIEFKFKSGKIGLQQLNLVEESGSLIGIMGGSGAGKSTLLNILNGNEKPSSGAVTINGVDIHTEKDKIEGVIGMVSQDDLLIEELTVFQNLFYNAKLCFDNFSDSEVAKMVLDLLNSIGLYETRDLKVGSPLEKTISGGQRKRLNIALELIREPSVLFVDEPTSGLSSRDSENIMDLLKELALKGKLLFVVIHQPSSDIFKMFDKLLILDLGGFPIYMGNPVEAVIYFKTIVNHVNANESECVECGNVNPEQIFNIIESKVLDEYGNLTNNRKVSPKQWNEYYQEKIESKNEVVDRPKDVPKSTFSIPNKFKQFKVFMTRDVLAKLTNKQYLSISLGEAPLLAFILSYFVKFFNTDASNTLGYVFKDNENLMVYLFMSVVVALFIGLTVSAEEIIKDRKILKRESFLNLSRSSYLISKISIMFMLSAIQTFTFVMIGNMVLGIKGMYFDYWLVLFTTSCFANMLGLNISSSFNSAVTIYILIPFLIIPQLLFSGVIVKFDKLNPSITSQKNVPLIGEIMTSRWAFEALVVNQFKRNEFERNFYKYDKEISISDYKKNYWISNLKAKIDKSETNLRDKAKIDEIKNDLSLIKNEIAKELGFTGKKVPFRKLDQISADAFNTDVANELRRYLDILNSYYVKRSNNAASSKDKKVTLLTKGEKEKSEYQKIYNEYDNESLNDLVRNSNSPVKILEYNNEYIQKTDPVFLDPPKDSFISAHFYAPRKAMFGKLYDTYWINLLVIWFMSVFLIFSLYFDLLKKLMDGAENLMDRIAPKKQR